MTHNIKMLQSVDQTARDNSLSYSMPKRSLPPQTQI